MANLKNTVNHPAVVYSNEKLLVVGATSSGSGCGTVQYLDPAFDTTGVYEDTIDCGGRRSWYRSLLECTVLLRAMCQFLAKWRQKTAFNKLYLAMTWLQLGSNLKFHTHVQNVKNRLRKRLTALYLFKKIGLSINHGLQFSMCVASLASYGLWWHAYLSKSYWESLESVWSSFLKKSAHEYCPKQANSRKIRELLGVRSFREFSDYLFHLRTANHHQKSVCKRYTLSPNELAEHRELTVTVRVGV